MSSRSLAAARARRAGENAPPVSGNRPITSIGSQAAFAPQQLPTGYQYNMPPPPNNVRTSRNLQQQNAYQQVQQSQQQIQNGLPFSKLSISDAIGLITLRLGRVEKWVIETENDNTNDEVAFDNSNLPVNSKIIDNSVFTGLLNRIESLEKREIGPINNEYLTKLTEDVNKLSEQITRISDEGVKHNLAISKHTEQLFRFERELVETKDILKTFMIKYDVFSSETNNKFSDFEYAITDLEKNFQSSSENEEIKIDDINVNNETINEFNSNIDENTDSIMSVDLKNIIKQELATISN
jgi:hypothetical protein